MTEDNWIKEAIAFAKDNLKIKKVGNSTKQIYDIIRKKWVVATKEEKIRQLLLQYLVYGLDCNKNLIGVEKSFLLHGEKKRFDIILYNNKHKADVLIELKNEEENLNVNNHLSQLLNYQTQIKAKAIVLTNGHQTIAFKKDNNHWVTMYSLEEVIKHTSRGMICN